MADIFLDNFEKTLRDGLVKVCRSSDLLPDELLESIDLENKWNDDFIEAYVADAVGNFNDYPEAALAWAGFLGMAAANDWDADWEKNSSKEYSDYYGEKGFDDMDEHILRDVLGIPLESPEARHISDTLNSCSMATLGLMRHEGIETQTAQGFYALARAYSVFFSIGVGIELHRLGYKKVPVFNSEMDVKAVKEDTIVS